jgi:hypothetical protein
MCSGPLDGLNGRAHAGADLGIELLKVEFLRNAQAGALDIRRQCRTVIRHLAVRSWGPASCPAMTCSISAASVTIRVIGPT